MTEDSRDDVVVNQKIKKKKKKRGKSLIFRNFFKPSNSGDDHDPTSGTDGKFLASDDNLVYCDINGNCVDPDVKKPPHHHRGRRMSRIFKAVLFDSALKKKHGTNTSETPNESACTSPVRGEEIQKIEPIGKIEKIDNSINENNSNIVKESKVDQSSTDHSDQTSLTSRSVEPPASSTAVPSPAPPVTTASQTITERKVNSVEKKSNPRPLTKPVIAEDKKPVAGNNTTDNFPLFVLVGVLVFVMMGLWMKYRRSAGRSSNAIAGDEL